MFLYIYRSLDSRKFLLLSGAEIFIVDISRAYMSTAEISRPYVAKADSCIANHLEQIWTHICFRLVKIFCFRYI